MEDLNVAARAGYIDGLYEVLEENPRLLEQIDEIPFVNTPLHIAAENGHTHFAIEIMRLKPSYSRKLNPAGLSPLDLALRKDKTDTVRRLIEIDNELIRIKGKESWTPLHYVAKTDNADLLAAFLVATPLSIEDLTIRKESAVHIAVTNGNTRALDMLMGWLNKTGTEDVLRWRDEKENTLLHILAYNADLYANNGLLALLRNLKKKIDFKAKNSYGMQAIDIIVLSDQVSTQDKEAARKILSGRRAKYSFLHKDFPKFLLSKPKLIDRLYSSPMRSRALKAETIRTILVVSTLIVTACYQAGLRPSTGLGEQNINTTSTTTIHNQNSYRNQLSSFYWNNSIVFMLSVTMILFVIDEFKDITHVVSTVLGLLHYNYYLLVNLQDVTTGTKIINFFTYYFTLAIVASKLWIDIYNTAGLNRTRFAMLRKIHEIEK